MQISDQDLIQSLKLEIARLQGELDAYKRIAIPSPYTYKFYPPYFTREPTDMPYPPIPVTC